MDNPILSASISVTDFCNLNCRHCYASDSCGKKSQLTGQEIKNFCDQLNEMGCFSLQISGGEPFLLGDIEQILETVSRTMKIYLLTNGTLLTKEKIEAVSKTNIASFQISLDSLKPENYAKIRGQPLLDTVLKNIIIASRTFRGKFNIGTVLMKHNRTEYGNILSFASSIGAKMSLIPLLTTGKGALESQDISINEKVKILNSLFKFDKNKAFRPVFPLAFYPREMIERGLFYNYCSFPFIVGIMPDGNMYPCEGLRNVAEMKMGNIKESNLEKIWSESKIIKNLVSIKSKDLKGVCRMCRYREECNGGCRASAYLHYKDFRMPDPICQTAFEAGLFPKDALIQSL